MNSQESHSTALARHPTYMELHCDICNKVLGFMFRKYSYKADIRCIDCYFAERIKKA